MICKYILTIGGVESEINKSDLKNWNEVEFSIKRSDFGGVVRSFSSSFDFVGETADRITEEFMKNYLYASAEIEVRTIQNDWTFKTVFSCPLDFATYKREDDVVSINAIDNSLAAIIKAKKNRKYEFLMTDMIVNEGLHKTESEMRPFEYEGLELSNVVSFRVGNWDPHAMISEYSPTSSESQKIPMSSINEDVIDSHGMEWADQTQEDFNILTLEELKKKDIFIVTDRQYGYPYGAETRGTNYILVNHSRDDMNVDLNMELTVQLPPDLTMDDIDAYVSTAIGWESNEKHDGNIYHMYDWGVTMWRQAKWVAETSQLVLKGQGVTLYPGYKLMFFFRVRKSVRSTIKFTDCIFDVVWKTKTPPSKLDYVRPATLLSKIVESMTADETGFSKYGSRIEADGANSECDPKKFSQMGDSHYDTRINHTILLSKDCIGQNPDQIRFIKTSFNDFCQWMEAVFGYVYVIESDSIVFRHRDKVFGGRITKYIDHSNETSYNVNKKTVFSTLEIGYKAKEEGYNSKYEFNRSFEYDTGINNTEKKLSLLSPYRADSVGFEMVYQKGLKEENDEKSSEDGIWCVYVEDTNGHGRPSPSIKVMKTTYMQYTYTHYGLFNVYLSPVYCLMANSRYISSFVRSLKLINKEVNDVNFEADFGVLHVVRDFNQDNDDCGFYKKPFFTIGEFEFETNDCELPVDMALLIKVRWKGMNIIGYIRDITNKYERVEQSRYTLIVKNIESL